MTKIEPVYLGDGVYARHDGFNVWLEVTNGFEVPQHEIALEPETFRALLKWIGSDRFFDPNFRRLLAEEGRKL